VAHVECSVRPAPRPESPRRPTFGAVGPGWRGVGSRPQSPSGDPGIGFQLGQRWVGQIPSEPPRVTSPDQLVAQAPAVGQADLRDDSPVAVARVAVDGHDLAEGQRREVLPRAGRIRLAALRGVDPAEPDDLGSASSEDGERVAVGDTDDPAGERLGRRRARQQEQSDGEGERVASSCAAGQGIQDAGGAPTRPTPSAARWSSGTAAGRRRCPRCRGSRAPAPRGPGRRRARGPR
jgi:hypothetical protein